MRNRVFSGVAVLYVAFGLAVPAGAQVVQLDTMIVDERPVLILPPGAGEFFGSVMVGGMSIRVTTDANLRTYRAFYNGRTYTAYEDASTLSTRLAFDPAARRFRALSATIRVELHNIENLDSLVRDHGALYGNAYPALGFALIRLGPDSDLARLTELMSVDPRVRDARLQFEPEPRLPMIAPLLGAPRAASSSSSSKGRATKSSLTHDLFVASDIDIDDDEFALDVAVLNAGAGSSDVATLRAQLLKFVPDDSTTVEEGLTASVIHTREAEIPALDGKGASHEVAVHFGTSELDAGETYYVLFRLLEGTEMLDDAKVLARGFSGFTLDGLKRVQHACLEPGRGAVPGTADPLRAQQWNLDNTGQLAYADAGGVRGEDLQMDDALMDGPTGAGVRVAVVDSGLEICHPDLRGNVEGGASYNFNAIESFGALVTPEAFRLDSTDPFNFDPTGDHGTSVAGVIAAVGNNGIGVRGVAPDVRLRGYNYLNAVDSFTALVSSLGASDFLPSSSDVDIFNLSWGSLGMRPRNPDTLVEQVFAHGARTLRSGLGAIYVKAAGNGFRSCRSLEQAVNTRIGCAASTGDGINNLPYVIAVSAFSANGRRSSYSSAGPNLWVTAPGGEYGFSDPALVSVDQMGFKRGLPVIFEPLFGFEAPLDSESAVNPDGDYTVLMNGTSAAAPNVTGAVALLLEEAPALTWRDVKYVLAKTARKIHRSVAQVTRTYGGNTRTILLPWTENNAGYSYHDWYGFGAVDIDAAVEFIDDYTPDSLGEFRQSGWFEKNELLSIPDNDGAGAAQTLSVSGLPADANIEAVILEIDVSHDFPNDLGIQLVSPHGTRSVLNQVFNETLAIEDGDNKVEFKWRILGNAFFGETPNGNWQIDVFDAADEDTGSLEAWRLQFYYGTHPSDDDES